MLPESQSIQDVIKRVLSPEGLRDEFDDEDTADQRDLYCVQSEDATDEETAESLGDANDDEETLSEDEQEVLQTLRPWLECPAWPPDLFAVAATIIELASCFTHASCMDSGFEERKAYISEVSEAAKLWRGNVTNAPDIVDEWWLELLVLYGQVRIDQLHDDPHGVVSDRVLQLLIRLLAVADEACVGVGWSNDTASDAAKECLNALTTGDTTDLKKWSSAQHSLCRRVSPHVCVVFPKALTTPVGCTVRSMSHHLALLPPVTVLKPQWLLTDDKPDARDTGPAKRKALRLLIVPFPFRVSEDAFTRKGEPNNLDGLGKVPSYFGVNQTWLEKPNSSDKVSARELVDELLKPLLESAKRGAGGDVIDGILLPELAFDKDLAAQVGAELALIAGEFGLKFFICGASEEGDGSLPCNVAMNWVFRAQGPNGEAQVTPGSHRKHHRWALDGAQIERYGLTELDPSSKSWEYIDVSRRELPFFAVRNDLCMTVLICEDLARADPAMQVIRAVGPNLVVALLMDGPQLIQRWPGRYATVLAEDPGSSVLSITSAGMVDRSNLLERNPVRSVGLWRHENGSSQELYLPVGHHGLLLSVDSSSETQFTLDHRPDSETTNRLKLRTIKPLALAEPPKWL
ncbi:ribonuclease H family protein [Paraburkholderia sp. RL17-337-BIB-A]|uniref:hypothetical protein n=1 Tax=Paraburkholderia sp. RL17-337-BIB-A TaxID=3031636 RepID=UPI0038BC01D7